MIRYHVIWSTLPPSFIESLAPIHRGDVVTYDGRTFEVTTVRHIPVPHEVGISPAHRPTLVMKEI